MRKKGYFTYNDEQCEMLKHGDEITVKDKASHRYYILHDLTRLRQVTWVARQPRVSWGVSVATVVLVLALSVYVTGASFVAGVYVKRLGWHSTLLIAFTAFTIVQILIHESAHWMALKYFGRKPDSMGFHLSLYVFPSVYVRMNDISMLPFQERLVVSNSGLLINSVIDTVLVACNQFAWHQWGISQIVGLYNLGLIFNVLPILHTDGYRVLLALVERNEARHWRENPPFIKVISVFSYFVAALYVLMAVCWLVKMITGQSSFINLGPLTTALVP